MEYSGSTTFGPGNAWLFQERHGKVARLGDVLGVAPERQGALVEAFEATPDP